MSDEPSKMGRPSDYSQEMSDTVCARLAQGQSVRTICKDADMPNASTIFLWLRTHEDFSDQYAKAKQESADAMAEDILDIADNGSNDYMERLGKDGESEGYKLNGEHIQRSKLRVDTRKFLMSKMKPKKYGEKLEIEQKNSLDFDNLEKLGEFLAEHGVDPSTL